MRIRIRGYLLIDVKIVIAKVVEEKSAKVGGIGDVSDLI